MTSSHAPPLLRRFQRTERGSAALEFALVAPVFCALLFAILETSIIFFAGEVLETANQAAARTILTGQTQTAAYSQSQFKSNVCNSAPSNVLFSCDDIRIDIRSYPPSTQPTIEDCVTTYTSGTYQYSPGGPGDVVVVRLLYPWQLVVTGLGWDPSNVSGNRRLLCATAAFRNEPYASPPSSP